MTNHRELCVKIPVEMTESNGTSQLKLLSSHVVLKKNNNNNK